MTAFHLLRNHQDYLRVSFFEEPPQKQHHLAFDAEDDRGELAVGRPQGGEVWEEGEEIEEISIAQVHLILDGGILADFNEEIHDEDDGFEQISPNLLGGSSQLELLLREGGDLKHEVDRQLDEVDRHVFHNSLLVGLAEHVLLHLLVVVLAEQLQKAEDPPQHFAGLLPLPRSCLPAPHSPLTFLLVVEP